jgi:hypothetical protein
MLAEPGARKRDEQDQRERGVGEHQERSKS